MVTPSSIGTHPYILNEARSPENESNKESTDMTIQLAMAMAVEGLRKMRDPRAAIRVTRLAEQYLWRI